VKQQDLFKAVPVSRLELQSREDLIRFITLQQQVNEAILKDNEKLRIQIYELAEKVLLIDDQYVVLKNNFFGKSSEKAPVPGFRRSGTSQG